MAQPCLRRVERRSDGPATVLAVATAAPANVVYQKDYADFYFNITNSNHMPDLKKKFQRMCERSGIKKRHIHLSEEILKANPSLCSYWEKSFDVRQEILVMEVPKLAKEVANKAIEEWGQPKSQITHLVFGTTSGVDMPGADWALTKLLGLSSRVKRLMLYQQGCYAGGTVMRVAKDLAENNKGARVLAVCCEITVTTFRGPCETHIDGLVGQALFGDGASAIIIGSDPIPQVERPWFQLHYAASAILPDSDGAIDGHLREVGLFFHLRKDIPSIISNNIASELEYALDNVFGKNIPSYNDLFWIVHPGGRSILDEFEKKLELKPEKIESSRHILSEFGNVSSACVGFIMDHMRKKSVEEKCATSGEGFEWGIFMGFGPGLTCETILLKSVPLNA